MTAKEYLKSKGMMFDVSFEDLQPRIEEAFGDRADEYAAINAAAAAGLAGSDELYALPKNQREAASLFSIDRNRYVKNFRFVMKVAKRKRPKSVIEFGSADGLLLAYLASELHDVRMLGIERAPNLAKISADERQIETIVGDYRELANDSDERFDMGICNFGWENSDLAPSQRPHLTRAIRNVEICQHCAEDLSDQLVAYFNAWSSWLGEDSSLLINGRIANPTEGWAFVEAGRRAGWALSFGESDILVVNTEQGFHERFPHLVFKRSKGPAFNPDAIGLFNWKTA